MSRIATTSPEPVEIDTRPKLSDAAKARIWQREAGICWLCTKPVPQRGPDVQYDHRNQRSVSNDDTEANIYPMHTDPCHRLKTAADARDRAKVNRIKKKHETPVSEWPGRGQLRGRGFSNPRRQFFEGDR